MCDHLSPISDHLFKTPEFSFGAFCKRPPLVSKRPQPSYKRFKVFHCFHPLVSNQLRHMFISMFVVCISQHEATNIVAQKLSVIHSISRRRCVWASSRKEPLWVDSRPLPVSDPVQAAQQAFPCGFGAKKNRGTKRNGIFGFSRMLLSPHFSCGLWLSLLFFAPKRHGNACYTGQRPPAVSDC